MARNPGNAKPKKLLLALKEDVRKVQKSAVFAFPICYLRHF